MGCKACLCNKTSTPKGIFIMIPSLEGWPTKAKEAPSPHEVRPTLLTPTQYFNVLGKTKGFKTTGLKGLKLKV